MPIHITGTGSFIPKNKIKNSSFAEKMFFDKKGWSYEEINIEELGWDRSKLLEVGKATTVPQIVIDDEPIGGYDDLIKLYS